MSDNALIRALRSFGQGASNAVASNVSAPVDGIAWLLRKGGLPIPQNPVGGSDWMAQQGLTATPQNRLAGLLGETAGMVGPAVVQAAAPKIAGGLLALDDKAMDMARQGIERRMDASGMRQNMFIGPSAKTWDAAKAKQAKELLDAGVPPEQVWAKTGTFRGADGKLRQEIDDSAALFNTSIINGKKQQNDLLHGSPGIDYGPTVGLLEHPELAASYGKNLVPTTYIGNKNTLFGDGVQGAFDAGENAITLNAPAKAADAKSTVLHELQHAIQQREGWGKGGSSQMAYQDPQAFQILKELRAKMATPMPVEQYAKQAWGSDAVTPEIAAAYKKSYLPTTKVIPQAIDRSAQETAAKEYYRRLAGEAEARLTQSRMGMNPMQRAASYPPSMFDVPIEQQIVRFK